MTVAKETQLLTLVIFCISFFTIVYICLFWSSMAEKLDISEANHNKLVNQDSIIIANQTELLDSMKTIIKRMNQGNLNYKGEFK